MTLLDRLQCPACGASLRAAGSTALHCVRCQASIPVQDGIVALVQARPGTHPAPDPYDVDQAIERLLEDGSLNDARVARAYARTAVNVKGRGRLRVARELHELGIARDVAAAALADVYGELDERSLVTRAAQKKLRGRPKPSTPADFARIYQHLLRQGFSPSVVRKSVQRPSILPHMCFTMVAMLLLSSLGCHTSALSSTCAIDFSPSCLYIIN